MYESDREILKRGTTVVTVVLLCLFIGKTHSYVGYKFNAKRKEVFYYNLIFKSINKK